LATVTLCIIGDGNVMQYWRPQRYAILAAITLCNIGDRNVMQYWRP